MAFRCTAFEGIEPQSRLSWECSPEELHRRRQAKYDELWGEDVGDQLAKGWADQKAQEPKRGNRLIPVTEVFGEDYEVAWHRTEVNNPTPQELWAEESSLP